MALISLNINDRSYEMTCDDGQEEHLQKLAGLIDERVRDLVTSVGPVGEPRLLVMASLLITDELYDAYTEIHALKSGDGGNGKKAPINLATGARASTLESWAKRVEAIAARIEGA